MNWDNMICRINNNNMPSVIPQGRSREGTQTTPILCEVEMMKYTLKGILVENQHFEHLMTIQNREVHLQSF